MSFSGLPFRLQTYRLPGGEARAFLLDSVGVPDSYSTLYVTATIRNAGKSVATQEAALNSINVLYLHCQEHEILLPDRFRRGEFLDRWEVEALRSTVQRNFGPERQALAKLVELAKVKKGHAYALAPVDVTTQRQRLSYIAAFLRWLAHEMSARRENSRSVAIVAMCEHILAVRPNSKRRGEHLDKNKFTKAQNETLNQLIEPDSPSNPFKRELQLRNKLLIYLLRSLGKRRGEVLNLRIADIKLREQRIDIVRRNDDPADPRTRQPLVKTREHSVPLYPELQALIEKYTAQRRTVPGARKHP